MLRNLKDAWGWIERIVFRIERLESGAQLGNSSITKGRMRFIGGLLLIDSGGTLQIIGRLNGSGQFVWSGDWRFTGNGAITGDVVAEGKWTQNGPWEFNGDGDIAGDVDVTGDITVLGGGRIKVGNVIITPGSGGRVTVGVGSAQVVLNGSNGTIKAGKMTIDPTEGGGAITFENGAQLYSAEEGDQIEMVSGPSHVTIRKDRVSVAADATRWIAVNTDAHSQPGIHMGGMREGSAGRYLGIDGTEIVKLASGGGGDPGDPPSGSPDGYIWPADPQRFGISDNYAAHVARGSAEPGVDVMTPVGTPLWAPGAGTILAMQSSPAGATGRYVTLITDEGDWFRFLHNSAVVVSAGQKVAQAQLLAYTGGSGFGSEAAYGPHSHISFARGYTGAFPGAGGLDDFQAYMAQS